MLFDFIVDKLVKDFLLYTIRLFKRTRSSFLNAIYHFQTILRFLSPTMHLYYAAIPVVCAE